MTLATTAVTFTLVSPDGSAIVGASVTALLSGYDYDGEEYVAQYRALDVTDGAGRCALDLWPNVRGSKVRTYSVYLGLPGVPTQAYHGLSVPDQDSVTFIELLGGPSPGTGVPDGALMLSGTAYLVVGGLPIVLTP